MLKVLHIFSKPENINARYTNAWNVGMTPLMLACENEHLEVIEFLLSSFDDIDVHATSNGWPTLWLCMFRVCAPEMIKLMLAMSNQRNLGLDINAKGLDGSTILFRARDDIEMTEFLIANGADVLARTNEGEDVFTGYWKESNEKFLEYLNVTEELTTLQRLELFTENLDFLSEAIPKKGKLEMPYTILQAESRERIRCEKERLMLFFLKTFRDQNIDLRIVEVQFIKAENANE